VVCAEQSCVVSPRKSSSLDEEEEDEKDLDDSYADLLFLHVALSSAYRELQISVITRVEELGKAFRLGVVVVKVIVCWYCFD